MSINFLPSHVISLPFFLFFFFTPVVSNDPIRYIFVDADMFLHASMDINYIIILIKNRFPLLDGERWDATRDVICVSLNTLPLCLYGGVRSNQKFLITLFSSFSRFNKISIVKWKFDYWREFNWIIEWDRFHETVKSQQLIFIFAAIPQTYLQWNAKLDWSLF